MDLMNVSIEFKRDVDEFFKSLEQALNNPQDDFDVNSNTEVIILNKLSLIFEKYSKKTTNYLENNFAVFTPGNSNYLNNKLNTFLFEARKNNIKIKTKFPKVSNYLKFLNLRFDFNSDEIKIALDTFSSAFASEAFKNDEESFRKVLASSIIQFINNSGINKDEIFGRELEADEEITAITNLLQNDPHLQNIINEATKDASNNKNYMIAFKMIALTLLSVCIGAIIYNKLSKNNFADLTTNFFKKEYAKTFSLGIAGIATNILFSKFKNSEEEFQKKINVFKYTYNKLFTDYFKSLKEGREHQEADRNPIINQQLQQELDKIKFNFIEQGRKLEEVTNKLQEFEREKLEKATANLQKQKKNLDESANYLIQKWLNTDQTQEVNAIVSALKPYYEKKNTGEKLTSEEEFNIYKANNFRKSLKNSTRETIKYDQSVQDWEEKGNFRKKFNEFNESVKGVCKEIEYSK
ncbi:MAG: hypothetical protein J0H68_03945 [Sphingobacteriia bacterium]|nr:hypothetical protein [Sphingobacteriia bacterium]